MGKSIPNFVGGEFRFSETGLSFGCMVSVGGCVKFFLKANIAKLHIEVKCEF